MIGDVVYSTQRYEFEDDEKIEFGDKGKVTGPSDDGEGLEVKFDSGVVFDMALGDISTAMPVRFAVLIAFAGAVIELIDACETEL